MSNLYDVELTDTFGGEANYAWVRRARVAVPELTHYGYSGSTDGTFARANASAKRELARAAKASVGLTGEKGRSLHHGDSYEFRPYNRAVVLFASYVEAPVNA